MSSTDKKFYREVIHSNVIQCTRCLDIIESTHRHDFKWCGCGSVAVDGGKSYLKRCFKDGAEFIELSDVTQEEREPYDWELK